jgi:hypothetical protein
LFVRKKGKEQTMIKRICFTAFFVIIMTFMLSSMSINAAAASVSYIDENGLPQVQEAQQITEDSLYSNNNLTEGWYYASDLIEFAGN